jgi:hypothetical protein
MADESQDILSLFPEIEAKMDSNAAKAQQAQQEPVDDYAGPTDLVRRDMSNSELRLARPAPYGRLREPVSKDSYPSLPENTYLRGLIQGGNKPLSAYNNEVLSGVDDSYVSVGEKRGFVAKADAEESGFRDRNLRYLNAHENYWSHLTPGFFPWGPVYATELPPSKRLAPDGEIE